MPVVPTGTVTFFFTDIEGSTRLAQSHPAEWESARQRHHAILRYAIESHRGFVFQVVGDAFCAAFTTAGDGVQAALSVQRALLAEPWGEVPIRVRIGLHTGAAEHRDGEYHGYLTLAHAQRVMSTAYGGQTLVSNTTAALLSSHLPADVSLRDMGEQRLKGILNPERLWQLAAPDLPHDFPPLQSFNSVPNNLPIQVTSFVGREREVAELQRLLLSPLPSRTLRMGEGPGVGARLLTLTGSGGTGKTRLSLQIASEVLDHYEDGVWFIELAPLTDPALIPYAVASALGIREEQARPILATLLDWLRARQLLLILDNCEHLIEACAKLADAVLHASAETQLLASSREALGIAGETAYRVPSLECPSTDQASRETVEQLTQYAAVQLFIERAAQSQTTFIVTNANAPAVAQICYRLDGIPLAIELAAARVKALPVEKIAERLDDRFRLLTGGSRTALPRQQTLRALIDWSYNLLSEPERLLLQRLSVFAGGWTLEAAEGVCAGEGIDPNDILDLLIRLQDKSLISMVELGHHSRYRLLETIRQYARDKLLASGQPDLWRERHLQWYTQLAESIGPKLRSAERALGLATLEQDLDNFRTAITWGIERQSDNALRLVGALFDFWLNSHLSEGHITSARAMAALGVSLDIGTEHATSLLRAGTALQTQMLAVAKTVSMAGALAFVQGDYPTSQARFDAADTRARAVGDPQFLGVIKGAQGMLKLYLGDHVDARTLLEQSVSLAIQAGDVWGQAYNLWLLGDAIAIDDPSHARRVYEESLSLFRQIGDRYWMTSPQTSLGHLLSELGDYAQARALLEESLAIRRGQAGDYVMNIALNSLTEVMCGQQDFESAAPLCAEALTMGRTVDNKSGIAWSLRNQAAVAAGQGDITRAEMLLRESLSLYRELGQKLDIALVIEGLAQTALTLGAYKRGTVLYGTADALRQSIHAPRLLMRKAIYDRNVAAARAQLGGAAFEAALATGRALTMEEAVALAQQEVAPPPAQADAQTPAMPADPSGLTARERDVLRLLAEGLSNQQIAERLVVSAFTVRAHLRAIYDKLGVTTRSAATRHALEHHLV